MLTPAESATLLTRLLGAERVGAEPDAAAELAALCGHLPLALRIAAANLSAHPLRGIADYTKELATGDRLTALQMDGDPHTGVRAAFDHSYAALRPEARQLFRMLGLLPGPDTTPAAAAALSGAHPTETARLLDQLASANLVEQHTCGRFTMHDLVRLYAADRSHAAIAIVCAHKVFPVGSPELSTVAAASSASRQRPSSSGRASSRSAARSASNHETSNVHPPSRRTPLVRSK